MRWRISSADRAEGSLSFQRLDQDGYQPIDFSQSFYPGGGADCADGKGSCFQYVLRGAYAPPAGNPHVIQATHATFGVLPGEPPTATTVQTTVSLVSFFHTGNDLVYVNITDQVASDGPYAFARAYDRSMWPTNGLCLTDSPPDTAGFSPLDATGGFPPVSPLTDAGIYCVGIRPVPADAVQGALAQTRIATLPQITPMHLTYVPPIEQAPVIYQIVLDLEIPVAGQCPSAIQNIESVVAKAMNQPGVTVQKLPTINLAVDPSAPAGAGNCTQSNDRTVDATVMSAAVKQTIESYPQTHQQFHLFYFNNLNAPLPDPLSTSLRTLFDDLESPPPGYELTTISWLFNPGLAVLNQLPFTNNVGWQSADDPSFPMALDSYAQMALPYTTQIHDPSVPVPLLSPADAARFDGGQFKICVSSSFVQPVDTATGQPLGNGPSWPIAASDPPGFTVFLETQLDTPVAAFVPAALSLDFQVCTRYCTGHPYVATAGQGVQSWATSPLCAVTH